VVEFLAGGAMALPAEAMEDAKGALLAVSAAVAKARALVGRVAAVKADRVAVAEKVVGMVDE